MKEERTCKKCDETKPIEEFRFRDTKRILRRWDCYTCYNKQTRKYHAQARKHRNTQARKRWRKNPEKHARYSKRHRAKTGRYVLALRSSIQMAKRHNWMPCMATPGELEAAFTGKCYVCGVPEETLAQKLHMDHSHKDGHFRGWLCSLCNMALGALKDSPETAMNLALYAEQHKEKIHAKETQT